MACLRWRRGLGAAHEAGDGCAREAWVPASVAQWRRSRTPALSTHRSWEPRAAIDPSLILRRLALAPALAGKIQAIPEQVNTQWIQAGAPGVYRGNARRFAGRSTPTWNLWPLVLGACDMVFPRLNALSYWVFLFAGICNQVRPVTMRQVSRLRERLRP